jgi:formylglycine-generating enzyme required for sulfatase activity
MWREWELSARYRGSDTENTAVTVYASPAVNFGNPSDGIYWTKGNSVSGATKSYTDPASDNSIYAVYNVTSTADVKSKQPNALGLYDMSGNVKEWCFKYYGMFLILGGQWNINSDKMQVGEFDDNFSENEDYTTGFRLARNK